MEAVADFNRLSRTSQKYVLQIVQAMQFAVEDERNSHDWIPLDPDQKEWKQEEAKKLREE